MNETCVSCITNPVELMARYLGAGPELTNDDREVLLFALYVESKQRGDGITAAGMKLATQIWKQASASGGGDTERS